MVLTNQLIYLVNVKTMRKIFFQIKYAPQNFQTLLLLAVLSIDTGFKKGRGNRQGGGKSQFEFPARMILLKKSFVTFSSQKSRPVKRPSIPLAYRAKRVRNVLKL